MGETRSGVWWLLFVAVLVAGSIVMLVRYIARPTREAIEAMPPPERAAMFHRALADLAVCEDRAYPGLMQTCRQRAELVILFPECDHTCRERAQAFLPEPTR